MEPVKQDSEKKELTSEEILLREYREKIVAVISSGAVVAVVVTNPGSGYTSAPAVIV